MVRLNGATNTDQPRTVTYLVETFIAAVRTDLAVNGGASSLLRGDFQSFHPGEDVERFVRDSPLEAERFMAGVFAAFHFGVHENFTLRGESPVAEPTTKPDSFPARPRVGFITVFACGLSDAHRCQLLHGKEPALLSRLGGVIDPPGARNTTDQQTHQSGESPGDRSESGGKMAGQTFL